MTIETFENWTFSELGAAAHTLMHDLRGSWAMNYDSRMRQLEMILIIMESYRTEGKLGFKEELQGNVQEFRELAREDLEVTQDELSDSYDGRVFRDQCHFYEIAFYNGRTDRVADYLNNWTECEGWHWSQGVEND